MSRDFHCLYISEGKLPKCCCFLKLGKICFFSPGKDLGWQLAQQSHHVFCQGTSERGDERKDVHGNTIKKALLLAVGGGHGNLVLLVLVYG